MAQVNSFNREPSLDEIFKDPTVRALMDRDGAEEAHLRRLMTALCAARIGLAENAQGIRQERAVQ